MWGLETRQISCPYCGETFEILIDCSIERQSYIEDCPVCCRPITLRVDCTGRELEVETRTEDDCY